MTTATTCSNLAEAELLHSLLDENGIEAFVLDDAFGGAIRLQVADEQAEEAKRILHDAMASLAEEEGDEDDEPAEGASPDNGPH
jgi:Putative prokaryotic signal transducing protein